MRNQLYRQLLNYRTIETEERYILGHVRKNTIINYYEKQKLYCIVDLWSIPNGTVRKNNNLK